MTRGIGSHLHGFRRAPVSGAAQLKAALLGATALTFAAGGIAAPSAALAQYRDWTGGVSDNWSTDGNWTGGQTPDSDEDVYIGGTVRQPVLAGGNQAWAGTVNVGHQATGALTVEEGVLNAGNLLVAVDGGDGAVVVTGPNSFVDVSGMLGLGHGGTGTLDVLDGASLTTYSAFVGSDAGSLGTVVVDGASFSTTGGGISIGHNGEGQFTVSGAGTVYNERTYLGHNPGSDGTLTITGPGSAWLDGGDIYVGFWGGKGALEVSDGGYLQIQNSLYVSYGSEGSAVFDGVDTFVDIWGVLSVGGDADGTLTVSGGAKVQSQWGSVEGNFPGAEGTATVTGAGSTWTATDSIDIALQEKGKLTVTDGGRVETGPLGIGTRTGADGTLVVSEGGVVSTSYVMMAGEAGSKARISLESGGVLEAQQVQRHDGTGTVDFDGGILRVTADQYYLFTGFEVGDITLNEGGGTIDTGAYLVQTDLAFVGDGGLTKTGSGSLEFWDAANTYSGTTFVSEGALRARAANVLSSASTHEVAAGATLRMDGMNGGNQTIGGLAGAGSVRLGNHTLTVGAKDAATSFGGVISGTGSVVKTGTGTLTLTGANTYTGGTTVSAGTLQIGDGTSRGSILRAVAVLSGATLDLVDADLSGVTSISNRGTTVFRNATSAAATTITNTLGAAVFHDTSTAGSATLVNNVGSISFDDESTAGTATITNTLGSVTFGGNSSADRSEISNSGLSTLTFRGNSSAGDSEISNLGTLEFTDDATAGTSRISNSGSLTFRERSTAGSSSLTVTTSASFRDSATAGSARIDNLAGSTLSFLDASSADESEIDNAGELYFYHASGAGSSEIANSTTGNVIFQGESSAGSASIGNDDTVFFYDDATAGGARITNRELLEFYGFASGGTAEISNADRLAFHEDSTAGDATITTLEGGTTSLKARSSGGAARFIVEAGGVLDISELETAGTEAGSIEGEGTFTLGGKQLTVGSNGRSTTVDGAITDGGAGGGSGGALVKVGAGTLTLAGANSYSGTTRVLEGKLQVTGSLLSDTHVGNGAQLSGSGTLGVVHIGEGGTLAPGNSIGSIDVGTLTLNAGAIYEVELAGGGNTAGVHNDVTRVGGTATLESGATIRVLAENRTDTGHSYLPGTIYTVIETTAPGSLVVEAAPEIFDDFAFLTFTGSHDGQNFYLTSSVNAASFCLAGATANQCATGDGIFSLGGGNAVHDLVLGLGESEVADTLDALSGEAHASFRQVIEATFAQFGDALLQRAAAGLATGTGRPAEPLGYAGRNGGAGVLAIDAATAGAATTASAWVTPLGGAGAVEGDGNAAGLDWLGGGLAAGLENSFALGGGSAVAGLALGYQRSTAEVAERGSDATIDAFGVGAYGGWSNGATALSGALAYELSHVATSRDIAVPGRTETATAEYWTQAVGLSAELAHAIALGGGTTLSPLATVDFGWSGHGGFVETGAGAFGLTGAAAGGLWLDAGIGLAVGHAIALETGTLTLEARALWEHAVLDGAGVEELSFAGGAPFTVSGPASGGDRLKLGAGIGYTATDGLTLRADYAGELADGAQAHSVAASVGVKF